MKIPKRSVISLLIGIASLVMIVAVLKAMSGLYESYFAFFIHRAGEESDYGMA